MGSSPKSDLARLLACIGVMVACAVGIALVQPVLLSQAHTATKRRFKREDAFVAPPPEQLRAMLFGYRAAGADLLWANLVLEYGLHWQEKRAFPDITRLIDAVIAVEPNHPLLYQFVDTMVLFTPGGTHEAEARTARVYLERGTKERPFDAELWLRYGQFLAFLGPSFLTDEKEIDQWRLDGAHAILHSVDLGADAARSLAALTILRKAGHTDAAKANIERLYSLTDDPDTREQLLLKARQLGETTIASDAATGIIEREWNTRYPFLSRSNVLLVGPHRSPSLCAGLNAHERRQCPPDWSAAIGQ